MKCAVIILNWNGEQMLKRYLPSVVSNTSAEIIVADNGSTDNSQSVAREFQNVRWVAFDKNYGFAEGYNRAIAQVDSEYVVLLNSDVEVTEGWLEPLIQAMDEDKTIAAVQPKVLSWLSKENGDDPVRFEYAGAAGGLMDSLIYPYCRGRILSYIEKDEGQYEDVIPVFWTTGACMCVRTAIYKQIGGLDADFFAHMEEIDLCWRLQCRGYELVCIPQSTIYHVGGGALSYESPRKTFLNFRNCLLMIYKNLPTQRLIPVWIARFVLDYMAALHLLVSGKSKNALAVVQARFAFWKMRPRFVAKRQANKQQATVPYPETIARRSIIFDYYFRKKRQ